MLSRRMRSAGPVARGGGAIDHHEAVPTIGVEQPCRWIDDEGGSAHDDEIGPCKQPEGLVDHPAVERFLIEDDVGADDTAAVAMGNARAFQNGFDRIGFVTAGAIVAQHRPVEFENLLRAGLLMQPIDILGDDAT